MPVDDQPRRLRPRGREVAVLVMVEAIGRLCPASSATPTRSPTTPSPPAPWNRRWRACSAAARLAAAVPDVLLSGHHGAIARWRRDEALRRTARTRPELLKRLSPEKLDDRDRAVLREAGFPVDGEDVAD